MTEEKKEPYVYTSPDETLDGRMRSDPAKPSLVAQEFIAEWGGERLVWRGDFYRYTGTHWEMEDKGDVMSMVNRELMASVYTRWDNTAKRDVTLAWNPSNQSLANLEKQLMLQAALPSTVEPFRGGEFIFLANGRFNLMTGALLPHDPSIFNLHACPFPYDPKNPEPAPTWEKFLKETFDGDQDSIDTHYLWMAYELSGATDLQKGYYLLGKPRSGKGTLMRISDALVGMPQVTAMSLRDFGKEFGMQALMGKSICRINDARDAGKETGAAVERLLGIIGGDAVQVNRKGVDPWVGHLGVRFTLASNEVLRLTDASTAITSRFILNRTAASHLGSEDYGLSERIIKNEMPGVLHRVLDYMDKVGDPWPENKRVTWNVAALKAAASPLLEWADECGVTVDPDLWVPRMQAYQSYRSWAEANGHRTMSNNAFGRALRACFSDVVDYQPSVDGKQVRAYQGISIPHVFEE